MVGSILSDFINQTICLGFIGHYGTTEELAGVGLGNMIASITFIISVLSFNGALDTLLA